MINREIIRAKVLQLVYAYYQNGINNTNDGNNGLNNAEKELMFSLGKAYDLYNYMLELMIAIGKEMTRRYEIALQRADREGTEKPSAKFVENLFLLQLSENTQLNDYINEKGLSWADDQHGIVMKIAMAIEQSDIYMDYMAEEEKSYDNDREIWRKIYKTFIHNNEELEALLEEKSLYWNDDKDVVDTFVIKTIKRFDLANGKNQELLPEYSDEDGREFARRLFLSAITNAETYQRYMSEASRNWDFSRLAFMDIIIMQIAIAEMLNFTNIPVTVTINEYVDLAKFYSTPRSSGYINGMLDSIARHLIKTGKMFKTMPER